MQILQIGNFGPEHSTENHLARAFAHNGHHAHLIQEDNLSDWAWLSSGSDIFGGIEMIAWTRTGWDWAHLGMDPSRVHEMQLRFLINAKRAGVPVVGLHLDVWWGLKRETEVFSEPFFLADLLCTADGGHDDRWKRAGVAHHWMPPGVSLAETEPGMYRSDLASRLTFVGSWQGGYHPESEHRHQLVQWLKDNWGQQCEFWPRSGNPAIRGEALRDLYASVDVVVGDSCFTGTGLVNYWSDRIPETVGRGGYLLHPYVEGMVEQGFTSETMGTWTAFDWEALGIQIEWALSHPDERREIARAGREMVRQRHTYEIRTEQIIELLYERKLLKRPSKAKKAVT